MPRSRDQHVLATVARWPPCQTTFCSEYGKSPVRYSLCDLGGIPLLMVIFWVYFLVPVLTGYPVTGFVTVLCALVIYDSAYLGEIVRAGIEGLPKGQAEASRALGMSYMKTRRAVILPQALYNVVPSMVTQFVSTIKETSLGYIINVQEISFAADQINNGLLTTPFPVYLILALSYFALCYALTQLAR